MITWSGYGILAAIIIFLDASLANWISNIITNDESYYEKNLIPLGISLLVSGVIIRSFSQYFETKRREGKGTRVFDSVTIAAGNKNRLLLIPFQYWSYISSSVGIAIFLFETFAKK
ncbi:MULTISPECIES: hypothetical protein [Chitinophagaceae]